MRNALSLLVVLGVCFFVFAQPARGESWWVREDYTADAGQVQFCFPSPAVKFSMRGSANAFCAYGYKLGDAGTASRSDAGAPLVATTQDCAVTMTSTTQVDDAFLSSGTPFAARGDQCIACTPQSGSFLTIKFYQRSP